MDTQRDIRLFDLLEEAASWPRSERRERAEAACAGGPVAADELLSLLARTERLTELFDPGWLGEDAGLLDAFGVGDRVGRYTLLELLGEGGMGRVFLAEQQEPRRRVALKLVRAELVGPAGTERFRAEQQALARLNHGHVAQFYEADVTDDGQPYFAMEWIDGERIDRYFAARPPDLGQTLGVVLDVCSAVRHAHQKQVIHRDLKPSNILVREVEGRPVAKVIDFGISEALEGRTAVVAGEAGETGAPGGLVFGTPEYLSPESFDGDVDTRADVYALGVLLYELLSGTRPFPRRGMQVAEYVRRLVTGDKEAPSVAVVRRQSQEDGGEPASSLAFGDEASRRRWARRLRGDLDAVVAKAMHPDRDLRYASVADLAADLEAFLDHRPVAAREPGTVHRARLLLRRRWRPILAATLVVLSLVAGGVGLAVGMLRARTEAAAARAALEQSEELNLFLGELFQEADPGQAQGDELTAREILDQGAERLEGRLESQPLVRARMLRTIGDIYAKLGHFEPAETLLVESLDLYRLHAGDDIPQVARAESGLAVMRTKAGELEAARKAFEQALATLDREPDADPGARRLVLYHLGVVAFRQGRPADADAHFDAACGAMETAERSEFAARCLEAFGRLRIKQRRLDEAGPLLTESLQIREELLGADHPHVAASLTSLCILATHREEGEEALRFCRRAYDIQRKALGAEHPLTVVALSLLASKYRWLGLAREEEAACLDITAIQAKRSRRYPPVDESALSAWVRLGWFAWTRGDYAEAGTRYRSAADLVVESGQSESSSAYYAELGLGLVDWKQGRLEQAERRLLELHEESVTASVESREAWTAWGLAGVYRDRAAGAEDRQRAEALYQRALEIRRRPDGPGAKYLALVENDYQIFLARRAAATR